jgi:hypothetical protein
MTDGEQRNLARRLADASEVFDLETALEVVRFDPTGAEELLRDKEERKKMMEELELAHQRLERAARDLC